MFQNEKCDVFLDLTGEVVCFVCEGLKQSLDCIGKNITLGVRYENKLIAGVVFNDIRPKIDVWLTIFSTDKRWCNRRVLRAVFNIAFNFLECKRASVRVDALNEKSKKLVEGLGFQKEGLLRSFEDNGHDAIIYSMLKNECQWRTIENE